MNTYNKIDLKKLERSANDTYRVFGMIGCLIRAITDLTHDNVSTEEEILYWQIKSSLELAYDILDNATTIFFEVVDIVNSQSNDVVETADLSKDEVELLTIYRLMPPKAKERILNRCRGWMDGYTTFSDHNNIGGGNAHEN